MILSLILQSLPLFCFSLLSMCNSLIYIFFFSHTQYMMRTFCKLIDDLFCIYQYDVTLLNVHENAIKLCSKPSSLKRVDQTPYFLNYHFTHISIVIIGAPRGN